MEILTSGFSKPSKTFPTMSCLSAILIQNWKLSAVPKNTSGPMLKTIQNQLNLIYLNTDEHTHLDKYGNTDILDMAFILPKLSKHDIQFLIGYDLGSDHLPIEIAIDTPPHRNININRVRYKFSQTDREVSE